jgi:hypothetical protein
MAIMPALMNFVRLVLMQPNRQMRRYSFGRRVRSRLNRLNHADCIAVMKEPRECYRLTASIATSLLALLTRCAPPETDCTLHKVAQIPLQVQDDLLIVPASIHGKITPGESGEHFMP